MKLKITAMRAALRNTSYRETFFVFKRYDIANTSIMPPPILLLKMLQLQSQCQSLKISPSHSPSFGKVRTSTE